MMKNREVMLSCLLYYTCNVNNPTWAVHPLRKPSLLLQRYTKILTRMISFLEAIYSDRSRRIVESIWVMHCKNRSRDLLIWCPLYWEIDFERQLRTVWILYVLWLSLGQNLSNRISCLFNCCFDIFFIGWMLYDDIMNCSGWWQNNSNLMKNSVYTDISLDK